MNGHVGKKVAGDGILLDSMIWEREIQQGRTLCSLPAK